MNDEQILLKQLKKGDEKAYSLLFRKYYKDLVMFAGSYIPERAVCEDVVQAVFLKIWEKRKDLNYNISFKSFLLTSVRNGCLDELRHLKVRIEHQQNTNVQYDDLDYSTENQVLYSELKNHLNNALSQIPEKQRDVFNMSRIEGLKYKEIADKLKISERTVEDRMAKTMKSLLHYLKDFLSFFICLYFL